MCYSNLGKTHDVGVTCSSQGLAKESRYYVLVHEHRYGMRVFYAKSPSPTHICMTSTRCIQQHSFGRVCIHSIVCMIAWSFSINYLSVTFTLRCINNLKVTTVCLLMITSSRGLHVLDKISHSATSNTGFCRLPGFHAATFSSNCVLQFTSFSGTSLSV